MEFTDFHLEKEACRVYGNEMFGHVIGLLANQTEILIRWLVMTINLLKGLTRCRMKAIDR